MKLPSWSCRALGSSIGPLPAGQLTPDDADVQLHGEGVADFFGRAGTTGDYDGDGVADLIVSAPSDPYSGELRPGRVYVFLGPLERGVRSAASADVLIAGVGAHPDQFGRSISACHLDDDEGIDLVVGAHTDSEAYELAGKVYLISGRSGL